MGALRYDTAPVAGQRQAKTVVNSGRRAARDGVRVPGGKGSGDAGTNGLGNNEDMREAALPVGA